MMEIELTVNGSSRRATVEPRRTLAEVLREELHLTGTHLGCEHGVCGACTVLLDGEPVRSCLVLGVQARGADVVTVEGLASGPDVAAMHPVQRAFYESLSFQCGFCTPGFVMTTTAYLTERAAAGATDPPTEDEIRAALSSNLCRCTGYQAIVEGVRRGRAHGGRNRERARRRNRERARRRNRERGGEQLMERLMGTSVQRVEDPRILTGRGRYVDDLQLPGTLHAAFVRSPFPHARITGINAIAAREAPGVALVLTAAEMAEHAFPFQLQGAENQHSPVHSALASDRVRLVGDAVAVVVAAQPRRSRGRVRAGRGRLRGAAAGRHDRPGPRPVEHPPLGRPGPQPRAPLAPGLRRSRRRVRQGDARRA